jgi:hypothetical protein
VSKTRYQRRFQQGGRRRRVASGRTVTRQ